LSIAEYLGADFVDGTCAGHRLMAVAIAWCSAVQIGPQLMLAKCPAVLSSNTLLPHFIV